MFCLLLNVLLLIQGPTFDQKLDRSDYPSSSEILLEASKQMALCGIIGLLV